LPDVFSLTSEYYADDFYLLCRKFAAVQCLNCWGVGWVQPPTVFFNPFNTLSNYALGVSYLLYTQDLHRNFGWALTVEKFNPQLIFYNSNTAAVCQKIATPLCSPTILTHKAADQIMGVGIFCFFRRK